MMTVVLPVASLELEEAHLDDKYLKLGSTKIETAEEVRQSHPCRKKKHFITASSTPAAASTTPKGAFCTVPGLSPKPNYFGLAARCGRCSRNGVLVDTKSLVASMVSNLARSELTAHTSGATSASPLSWDL